jgi:DNA-binding XRE family transcriptional regulator
MKTEQKNGVIAKRVTVKGKRMVMLDESEFDRLLTKADEFEPLLPEPDADGNYPAYEYLRASLALKIVRDRRRLGLTQVELARRAGIRPESLNRIEQNRVEPSSRTVEKIDRALRRAEKEI